MERERRSFGSGSRGGDRGGFGGGMRSPPVQVGEELEVKIEAIGEKGDGVAKKDGFVLFVPNVKQGQNVKVKITRVLRKVGFAEVVGAGSASSESTDEAPAEAEPEENYAEENDSENFGESSEETSEEPSAEPEEDPQGSNDLGEDQ